MANTTVRGAFAIHGQNPQVRGRTILLDHPRFTLIIQYLVEAVIRNRIYDSIYWKEHCFALTGAVDSHGIIAVLVLNAHLTAETLIDKTIELQSIGGVYGNQKPTEFICLLLKLLQIQPEKEILVEYLSADEFKLGLVFRH